MSAVAIEGVTGTGRDGYVHAYSAFEPYELSDYMSGLALAYPDLSVSIERMSTAALIDRLQKEGDAPGADIIFGWADTALRMPGIEQACPLMDEVLRPTGFSTAFIVDEARLAELGAPVPRRWTDLLHPALQGALAFPDPRQSGAGFLAMTAMLQHFSRAEGWSLIEGIDARTAERPGSAFTPAALVGEGKIAVGITVRIAAVKRRSENPSLLMVEPEDLVGAEAEVYAPLGRAPSKAARAVVAWAGSEAARPYFARYHKIDLRRPEAGVVMIDAERAVAERRTMLDRYTLMRDARRAAEKVVNGHFSRALR